MQKREVNLVRVWEGMDTQIPAGQKQGRNRLAKLAIHILSVVANSAGCERVFSEMGIVQTKHRSRLGLDKVRKTALIRMDIKRRHVAEGLIRPRSKRTFDAMNSDFIQPLIPSISLPPSSELTPSAADSQPTQLPSCTESPEDNTETPDIANFDDITKELVQAAAESDRLTQEEQDTDEPLPAPQPNPPNPPSTSSRSTRPSKTRIPLKSLFRYPTDPDAPAEGLDFYWKWGIKHLEEEMSVAELMTESLEDIDEV
jgi:hAT family C-terminal dimerisation region